MKKILIIIASIFLMSYNTTTAKTTIETLQERYHNPSKKYVMVAAHRGDWRNYADNSIEGIESCIAMGVDIVEVDLSRTKDGHLILMHDKTVDRTTNGKGEVKDLTLAEIRKLYLKNGLGRASEIFKVPTLEEALDVTKDRILVNLDKSDKYFDQVYEILVEKEMLDQVFIKSDKEYDDLLEKYGDCLNEMMFIPVMKLENQDEEDDKEYISEYNANVKSFEVTDFLVEPVDRVTKIYNHLQDRRSHLWINTLWSTLGGGYTDDKALTDPDGNWGYWIKRGATILQTDRPAEMLEYLRAKNLHD